MTFYREILAIQSPFDIGPDDTQRARFSVNFDAVATAPSTDFEREIGRIISDAGLGTFGTDMFIGTEGFVPTGTGPYVQIINTGGGPPEDIHNGGSYEHLSCQIVIRAAHYDDARNRALAIWRELDGTRNSTVVA
jgi:hypothetical protein